VADFRKEIIVRAIGATPIPHDPIHEPIILPVPPSSNID